MEQIPVSTMEGYRLLHEGAQVLSIIEGNGVRVDKLHLKTTIENSKVKIRELEQKLQSDTIYTTWKRAFGEKASLASRDQLGTVIFGELGHKPKKDNPGKTVRQGKTIKLRYIADKDAFEDVDIPFLKTYFEMEEIKNGLDTWLLGIDKGMVNGRIHPHYNLNTVISFRSSCNDINFQNVPVRNWEVAQMVRRCYIPDEGDHFGEVDYAQQEVRAAACYNYDPRLIAYIKDPTKDMHFDQAQRIFMLEPHQVGRKSTRDCSKNMFVFPAFYGSYYVNMAKDIWRAMGMRQYKVEGTDKLVIDHLREKGINELGACDCALTPRPGTFEHHMKKVEDQFWEKMFPVYAKWKKLWYNQYLQNGYFHLLSGFVIRGVFNKKEVSNYPVQGFAFHCLLWSLIELQKKLRKYKMKTKLIGQIHDSHQSNVPVKERNAFADMCRETMVNDIAKAWKDKLIVPLDIEVEYSDPDQPWSAKREWIKGNDGLWLAKPKKV